MKRENEIQRLLRHAFGCLKDNPCSCKKNIQKFLQTDKTSLEWVEEIKKEMSEPLKEPQEP